MSTPQDWFTFPTGKIPTGEYCECCGRYNARHLTCTALVINAHHQVLLTKRVRDPMAGWWCMPGGYIDWHETVQACAAREVKEEVGLTVEPESGEWLGIFSDPHRDQDGRQNVDVCFVFRVDEVEINANPEEVSEFGWFAYEKLPAEIAFDHRQHLDLYFSKK